MNNLLCRLTKNELLAALGFLLAALALQYSPVLIERLVSVHISFVKVSPKVWEADLSNLEPGNYYLSVGRPHGSCEIFLNGHVLSSTKGELSEIRPQLILGAGFKVLSHSSNEPILAKVMCEEQSGFSSRLHHNPVVANFLPGFILQAARIFTDLMMGLLASLLLIFSILLSPPELSSNLRLNRRLVLFAIASLFYSASLAQMGSLFLGGIGFTVLHIVLRNFFAGAFVYLCSSYSRSQAKLLFIHLLVAIAAILEGVFASSKVEGFYDIQYALFPLSSLIVTLDLIRFSERSRITQTLISLGLAWTVLQCVDFINMVVFSGPYVGPAFIAIIAFMVAVVRYQELFRSEVKAQMAIADANASAEIVQLSAKIAHDVRSPLALLRVLSRDDNMPDGLKKLLLAASDRISGIADTLLEKNRKLNLEQAAALKAKSTVAKQKINLVEIISIVVEEKRRITETVQIHFDCNMNGQIFGRIDPLEFSRLLSNLIDNAIEAVDANGVIVITMLTESEQVLISIKDNGRGIPDELLPKLFQHGVTFGKLNGNGLGLFSAKKAIEAWGGAIKVNSIVGHGAEVLINFPIFHE